MDNNRTEQFIQNTGIAVLGAFALIGAYATYMEWKFNKELAEAYKKLDEDMNKPFVIRVPTFRRG